ncbi:sensor histidine kinase [Pseudoalteromonas distincta]|uniref:sensor histidine kinase n=1 Tax=Pseudoalteromonas distincta TaxID=77608 RepID=UPI0032E0A47B
MKARWLFSSSLERSLVSFAVLSGCLSAIGCYFISQYFTLSTASSVTIVVLFLVIYFKLFMSTYNKVISSFNRNHAHLDAILNEDYNQLVKPSYQGGSINQLQQSLITLSEELFKKKSRYDQHVFLVYQLIEHFNVPIMVLDQNNKLSYANNAYSEFKNTPWQTMRYSSAEALGLIKHDAHWQLSDAITAQQWQIRHSEFIEQGSCHQLIVMINITSALRENQLQAWQQIIRVLGHEIRNSLTPVIGMAENLAVKLTGPRQAQALNVISERCNHLNEFVTRYGDINKALSLNIITIDSKAFFNQVCAIYPDVEFTRSINCSTFNADRTFLHQVIINLIKNAIEASSCPIKIALEIRTQNEVNCIAITDNGHGLANPDNIFVPFYTTKHQGQGIGLSFCRNVIEQHNGSLSLANRDDSKGAVATILLPI